MEGAAGRRSRQTLPPGRQGRRWQIYHRAASLDVGLYNNPAACGLERSAPEYRLACKTIRSKIKR